MASTARRDEKYRIKGRAIGRQGAVETRPRDTERDAHNWTNDPRETSDDNNMSDNQTNNRTVRRPNDCI